MMMKHFNRKIATVWSLVFVSLMVATSPHSLADEGDWTFTDKAKSFSIDLKADWKEKEQHRNFYSALLETSDKGGVIAAFSVSTYHGPRELQHEAEFIGPPDYKSLDGDKIQIIDSTFDGEPCKKVVVSTGDGWSKAIDTNIFVNHAGMNYCVSWRILDFGHEVGQKRVDELVRGFKWTVPTTQATTTRATTLPSLLHK